MEINAEYFTNISDEELIELIHECYNNDSRIAFLFKNQNILCNLLFKHFDIVDNPKKDLLYGVSYSLGHSSGLSEIYNYMSELLCLIK